MNTTTMIQLQLVKSQNYSDLVARLVKKEIKTKSIVYITTNKPYDTIVPYLEKKNIDTKKIIFIDCVSEGLNKSYKIKPQNCIFIKGPQDLTAISIAINEALKNLGDHHKTLFLDSISMLMVYNKSEIITRFSNFVLNNIRSLDSDAIIFAFESDAEKDLIHQLSSIVDNVVSA